MYLECQFARTIEQYCKMLEEDGKPKEAAEKIQDLQVETYGSMEKKEKVQYILTQIRAVLNVKDYVRTQIISKKISRKHIADAGFETMKIVYYQYQVQYWIHEKNHMEVAKAYQIIFDTITDTAKENFMDELPNWDAIQTSAF